MKILRQAQHSLLIHAQHRVSIVLAFTALLSLSAMSQNMDSVQITINRLTDKIYMLEGAGGNIGVLTGSDGTVLIDDQFAALSAKIKIALKTINDQPVKFVINTHYHEDHANGNENFGNDGAVIVAQENSRKRMTVDQFMEAIKSTQKAAPTVALPKITFKESVTLHLNGQTLEVFHVKNAHTDGDVIIQFKELNIFHAGDVFVRYGLPFIDVEHGGSIDGMISANKLLLSMLDDSSIVMPGHGDLAKKKDVAEFIKMMQTIRDRVYKEITDGKTLEQINLKDPTKEFKEGMERKAFVKFVYDSLKYKAGKK